MNDIIGYIIDGNMYDDILKTTELTDKNYKCRQKRILGVYLYEETLVDRRRTGPTDDNVNAFLQAGAFTINCFTGQSSEERYYGIGNYAD